MSHSLLYDKCKTHIQNHIKPQEHIAIAVSGGPDSMALLHLMQTLWNEKGWDLGNLHILTCDHNTRENTKEETLLVSSASRNSSFQCFTYTWDDFSEQTLRLRRHQNFITYCHTHTITKILTWHHLDDRIETSLLNMKRGSNIAGIEWITLSDHHFLDHNITLLRPLIDHNKEEILYYCQENHISYSTDPTNTNTEVSERNLIRKIIHDHFNTPNFYHSRNNLYDHLKQHELNLIQTNHINIIPQHNHDLITITCGQRTPNELYNLYHYYTITLNPRSTTLEELCKQLNARSGNKISYQGLIITAYTYASTVKKNV